MCKSTTILPCPVRIAGELSNDEIKLVLTWLRDGLPECIEARHVYVCDSCKEIVGRDQYDYCRNRGCGGRDGRYVSGFQCDGCDEVIDTDKPWEHSEEICDMRWQNKRADIRIGPKNTYLPYAPAVIELAVERNKRRFAPKPVTLADLDDEGDLYEQHLSVREREAIADRVTEERAMDAIVKDVTG